MAARFILTEGDKESGIQRQGEGWRDRMFTKKAKVHILNLLQ